MPVANALTPVRNIIASFDYLRRPEHLRVLLRTAGNKIRPARPTEAYRPLITRRQDQVLGEGGVGVHQLATIHRSLRAGPTPTIVLGGFVPDSTETVFLLRDLLTRHGSVYCVNYPRTGFSVDLLFAQLDDLIDEIAIYHQRVPVILSVSFGCGLVLEWLRRRRVVGGQRPLGGLAFVSPVACTEDLVPNGKTKASTLLGRAIQPYMNPDCPPDEKQIERSRSIFVKMFEAGAQNREALRAVMNATEAATLRDRVLGMIRGIDFYGACERVQSLREMQSPLRYFDPGTLPLSEVPTLVLYAEKEDSVVDPRSPTRFALETAHQAYFPRSRFAVVGNPKGSPVQHASLIFHHLNFRPQLQAFYARLRGGWLSSAA